MLYLSLRFYKTLLIILILCATLTGCTTLSRLSQVGEAPPMSQIHNPINDKNYRPITMPMPRPLIAEQGENSLWRTGARAFFKDQRAQNVGDIFTINIELNDKADISNTTKHDRKSAESVTGGPVAGYEKYFAKVLPHDFELDDLANFSSNPTHEGKGSVKRSEAINLKLAATIVQILPNGNFIVAGRQELRVNHEVRELVITGIVRPQDINSGNTVDYEKIAEARISYGGRGQISDVQQTPWGHQVVDILSPF